MAQMTMPKLSDTMEEGTILQWLVEEGVEVEKGAPLVEIETDKANMTVEAPESGTLIQLAAEGDTLEVGEPIAEIGGGGRASRAAEDEAPAEEEAEEAPAEKKPEPEPEEEPVAEEEQEEDGRTEIPTADDGTASEIGAEVDAEEMYPGARLADAAEAEDDEPQEVPAEEPAAEEEPARRPSAPSDGADGGRVKASPLARRLARELGVDLALVKGSGPDGRIVRADVEAAERGEDETAPDGKVKKEPAEKREAPAEREREPERAPSAGERVPLSRLQRTVASRMAASMREAPQFTLQRDVDAGEALALRRQLVEGAPEGRGPSLNDLIVRAVAVAAAEHPEAVSRFDDDALVRPEGIHVGIAVAVERGLLVPVIRDADRKSIGQIAAEARDLAARCRDGSITPRELEGSVISVSNLGMFGIDRFTAIINPPESAILAVGRAAPRAVVRDGELTVREQMTLTLSIDHRALYGAEGARFLGRIAELLERPGALVL